MRLYLGLPPQFWDEFYLTASHVHGKTTSAQLQGVTPWQLWHGCTPDLSYLREPGCWAFVLILNKNNPKIYKRSIECILLGYNTDSKTYWCYDPKTKQIYTSYHINFLESHDGHLHQPLSNYTPLQNAPALPQNIILAPLPVNCDNTVDQIQGHVAPLVAEGLQLNIAYPQQPGAAQPLQPGTAQLQQPSA
jgi:hypothetical protein